MIVSHAVYMWFVTLMTLAICVGWGVRDVYLLRRNWARRREVPDEIFGSVVGLAIITIGLVGVLKYHLGW